MSKTVEFYFDFGSPTAYLAHTQLPAIAERTGAALACKPMLLGGVFQATGNSTPAAVPAKSRYMARDIARCAAYFGVPYKWNPHFPVNTLNVMRGAVAAREIGGLEAYMEAVYRAVWIDERDTSRPETFARVLNAAGFDAADFAARIQDQAVKDALKAETMAAVERGVFGAPTMFVGEDMFFGQDRLDYVERALDA